MRVLPCTEYDLEGEDCVDLLRETKFLSPLAYIAVDARILIKSLLSTVVRVSCQLNCMWE